MRACSGFTWRVSDCEELVGVSQRICMELTILIARQKGRKLMHDGHLYGHLIISLVRACSGFTWRVSDYGELEWTQFQERNLI